MLIARCELTGTPHALGEARQFIRKHLDGQAHLEDTVLVVSELVTNAVRHSASGAGGTITVTLAGISGGVRIEVIDEGSPGPALVPVRPAWELTESGQGLRLVAEVTGGRWRRGRVKQPSQAASTPATRAQHEEAPPGHTCCDPLPPTGGLSSPPPCSPPSRAFHDRRSTASGDMIPINVHGHVYMPPSPQTHHRNMEIR